ncbi:MAG: HNH endonuclease signature motif containing protein [Microthrixaceae bacterium]
MSSQATLDAVGAGAGAGAGSGCDDALEVARARLFREEQAAWEAEEQGLRAPKVADPAAVWALERAEWAMDDLFDAGIGPLDSSEAVAWIKDLEHLGRRVDAARAALTATIQRRALHVRDGHGSAKIMIRHLARLSEGEATARAKTARASIGLPKVAAAWQSGDLPTCAVRVLGRVFANRRVAPAMVDRQDDFIADARGMGSKAFAHKAYRWERLIDEDGPEPANERNHRNRDARLVQNPIDLSWDLKGSYAPLQGAQMREILDRYLDAEFRTDWATAKAADLAAGGTGNITKANLQRTDNQRRADALHRIFQDATTAGNVIPAGFVHNIHWSATSYEQMLNTIDPAMDNDRAVRLDPDTHMCRTTDGYELDPTETVICSLVAKVRRIIVDATGVVIDQGRARRFTGSARTAATATHTHCIWPGCHTPASRCDIDHVCEHSRNGPTTQPNAAPLCGKHNRWKQKGYHHRRQPDGSWHTTRPDGSQLE